MKKYLTNYFKLNIYLFVFIGYVSVHAGSFDDFFAAVRQDNPEVVTSLIKRGFDVNTRNQAGEHALFLAVREPSPKVIDALLAWSKTDVEPRTAADESPLMMASIKGMVAVSRKLIERGADVNKPDWTPLHYAATKGHTEIMTLLLDNYAYIDASSPNGSTPLMMAAMYGTPAAVKLLLEAGADPLIKNGLGLTAIDFAYRDNRTESAEIIAAFVRGRQPKGKW